MVFRLPSISLFDWHLHLLYMAPAIIEDILALWHMTFQWDLKTIRFFLPSPELVIALRCHCASVDSSAQQPRCMCKACSFLWRPGSSGPFTEQNENHDFLLACTSNFMVSALAVFFWYLHSSLWKNVAPVSFMFLVVWFFYVEPLPTLSSTPVSIILLFWFWPQAHHSFRGEPLYLVLTQYQDDSPQDGALSPSPSHVRCPFFYKYFFIYK